MPVGTTCHETPKRSFSQPHWLSSPPSVRRLPVVVELLLRLAVDLERDRLVEREVRAAVDADEALPVQLELDRQHHARLARALPPCSA